MRDVLGSANLLTRRHAAALTSALLAASPNVFSPAKPSHATTEMPASAVLLSVIPTMPFGAPATNATLSQDVVRRIEAEAVALEALGQTGNAKAASLNGTWRLIYSNAREITNLASGLPLGFALGPTYQPVDRSSGYFENQGNVLHALGIARASTTVIGDVREAQLGTVNAAGSTSSDGNRIDVDFRRITFELNELFGRKVSGVRKIVVPKQAVDAAQPANDVLFLDSMVRVTRGGDDGIFIFRREDGGGRRLLSAQERVALFAEGGNDVLTGKGVAGDDPNAPPELRKLLKGRSAEQPF